MSTTASQLHNLSVYVPPTVAKLAFNNPQRQPGGSSRRFYAATAFADISGFTPLAEELAVAGVRGAEELTAVLNRVFEALITTVESHGGQVVKFGGDALSLIWPCETNESSMAEAAWRATQAAFDIQTTMMTRFATVSTKRGAFVLRVKIGLSAGRLLEVHAGGVFNRWEYVLAGAPMENMSSAENHAQAGEIVADARIWELLHLQARKLIDNPTDSIKPYLFGEKITDQFYRIAHLWDGLPRQPLEPPEWEQLEPAEASKAAAILRNYIPGAISSVLELGQKYMLAELKPMTVCFVGFSGIDYNDDVEAGSRLSTFMRDAQEMIYHYEGSVNKLAVGDKGSVLLVLFGAPPFFHEDDEVRGVACALALLAVGKRHELTIRVGLTAGPLFAGPLGAPERREYTVIGDIVNLAARLMQQANAGQVYVDHSVQSKTARFFEYADLGLLSLKGKTERRHAYHALGEKEQDRDERVMGYLLSNQELTGRDEEVAAFDAMADKVWAGNGQVLMLCGEAGIGKSRLLAEMVRRWMSRGGVTHGGDCVSYGEKTPYLPWRGIISSVAGLSPRLTPEQRINRLEGILHRLPEPEATLENGEESAESGGYWLERLPLIAKILGLEVPETSLTRAMPDDLRRDNVFATIQAIVMQEAQQRPTLILLEDTHWSDPLSIDLAAHISTQVGGRSLCLLLAYRPLDDARPEDIKRKSYHERLLRLLFSSKIMVNELDPEASLKLVQNKLDVKELPEPLAELVRRKGQGNPFFIEELVNSLLEIGALRVENNETILNDDLDNLEMPDTVQKVVLARIDRLPEPVKVTLKVAAVIGRHFQQDLLAAVHPLTTSRKVLSKHLEDLQADDFTRQEVKEDDLDFLFKHVITQEVAYETMLYSQRRHLHSTIGTVLETRFKENSHEDEIIDLLAHHYSRSDNRQKALEYLHRAGYKALTNYANEPAISYFSEALTVAEEFDLAELQFELLAGREQAYNRLGNRTAQASDLDQMKSLAVAHENVEQQLETINRQLQLVVNLGQYDEAAEVAEEGVALARSISSMMWEARTLLGWGIMYWRQGNYAEARAVMQKLLALNGAAGSDQLRATCFNYLGLIHTQIAEYEQARQDYQAALSLFRQVGDRAGEAGCANNFGLLESSLGRYVQAEAFYKKALAVCQLVGDRLREGISLNTLGQVQTILGHYESAQEQLERSLQIRRVIGDRRGEAFCLHDLGSLYLALGQPDQARQQFERACTLREELGERGNYVASLAAKGQAYLACGDEEAASQALTEAVRRLREGFGSGEYPTQNVWWAYSRVCRRLNWVEDANQALQAAYRLVKARAEQIADLELRLSYMESVPTNAAIIEAMLESNLHPEE